MYAVIETGGKQHKVEKGMVLSVDLLKDDVGKKITFENVLLYVDGDKVEVGQPYLDNVKVTAEVKNVVKVVAPNDHTGEVIDSALTTTSSLSNLLYDIIN